MTDNTAPQESATAWRMAGIVLSALGLYFINLAQTLDGIYLSFGLLVGLGIALAYTPTIAAAQPWFTQRRLRASGIAGSGNMNLNLIRRHSILALLCGLVLAALLGCAAPPRHAERFDQQTASAQTPLSTKRQEVVMQAMAMLDRNYVYNGKKLHTGFDCSGLVSFVYKESAGVELRGSASDIANKTRAIAVNAAIPGDLVFFNTLGSPNSHVGIYIGSGKFIHAANERTGVRIDQIGADYWAKRLEGYRSVL